MRYETAPLSLAIKLISAGVTALALGITIAGCWRIELLLGAIVLIVILIVCFLRAPLAYHISHNKLLVEFRVGRKDFGKVLRCAPVETCSGLTLRLWGNGGLFAGTGIFWNRAWGVFRAYVTSSDRAYLVLLETEKGKVLVSPEAPKQFMKGVDACVGVVATAAYSDVD